MEDTLEKFYRAKDRRKTNKQIREMAQKKAREIRHDLDRNLNKIMGIDDDNNADAEKNLEAIKDFKDKIKVI